MANQASVDNLRAAFSLGVKSYESVEQNSRGFYNNPGNPFPPKSLTYKEFERGRNHAFLEDRRQGGINEIPEL
jgi:hypothetical protein